MTLCSIGNALVDIIVSTDDAFLAAHKVAKGGMTLVDDATSKALYAAAGAAVEMSSGGSAANTAAGFASLGGRCAFMGKIGRDQFGEVFAHDLRAQNITFAATPSPDLPTGHCLIFVTPDAQRSMNTCLGAAGEFCVDDVDADIVAGAAVTYLEGYLFDKPAARQAFYHVADIAHKAGKKLALTLSDTFCVHRHYDEMRDLVAHQVDILFANENEILALYKTHNLAEAVAAARAQTQIAVITRGAQPTVIATPKKIYEIATHPVPRVVDTTGAGDLYAAGFLFGLTQSKPVEDSARIAAICAAEVISHYGPRPQKHLNGLV